MKIPAARRASGFTLVELLVVIVIIAALAAASITGVMGALQKAKKMTALKTCTAIEAAVNNYFNEYNSMPKEGTGTPTLRTDRDLAFLEVLLGLETTMNTRAIRFLDVEKGKGKKDGMILSPNGRTVKGLYDPWGGPYNVILDLDYEEVLRPAPKAGGRTILNGRRVAVWSDGQDGVSGTGKTKDDVKTW